MNARSPVVERETTRASLSRGGELWDNGRTTKDGPGRCANTVIPGPRRSVEGTD